MGAILEMILRPACLALMAALVLTGCGNRSSQISDAARGVLTNLLQRNQPEPPPLRERLTPAVLEELGGPILLVELLKDDAEAGAQLLRSNGDIEIWSTLNSIQFAFKDGVLLSTRGLKGDLMSSDVTQVLSGIRSGGRGAVRVNRYLDGEEQEVARALVCDYVRAGRERVTVLTGTYTVTRIDETCTSSSQTVENRYWIDTGGRMRKSVQWIGPFAGYVATERIND